MDVRLLGPVEVGVDGRSLPLAAAKQRALLAMLALRANRPVSADALMEGLWGEHPPPSAPKMVQQYVSQLRRLLADGNGQGVEIVTRGRAYELRIAPEKVDAGQFERFLAEGAAREALALWRGPALADLVDEPFAAAEIRRLDELRLAAVEQAIDTDLADGRHREVVAELEALVAEHPLSERLQGQLMLALYRSGRQADALEVYRRARSALVDEIGVEPGPELRRLHEAILRQDVALAAPSPTELPQELEAAGALVGRERELERLRAVWEQARGGHASLVLISGPEGVGRTRLAAELAGEVHRQGALVLYGAAATEQARAARRPTLLVLDHSRADGSSELPRLASNSTPRPLLIIVTVANGEPPGGVADAERIVLGPLGPPAIAAIAALYAPEGAEIPVADLAERSGGLPARVHRLAAEWARAETARRLDEVVARTAGERGRLRRTEEELAGTVVALQAMRERTQLQPDGGTSVICPFKGLASFEVDDAEFFCGRERLVAEMVARLVGSSLLGVVGPSGSGKSSSLRAGLLSEIAGGVLPGSDGWRQVLVRPGEHPVRALEEAMADRGGQGRLLIAVDQFEEVFTVCREQDERLAFIRALVAAAEASAAVVLAVRADLYGRCAAYPVLSRLLGDNHVLVGPMQRDELRRAIELPAGRAGLTLEPALVDRLLTDVEDEPGALPLLSSTLLELWQQRDGRRLRLDAYERMGAVRGAVARLAEAAYDRLDPQQQIIARRTLLRLTGDDVGGAPVRRLVQLEELEVEADENVRRVLDVLADSRLVTLSEHAVEVAHEALLTEWPRLRAWLDDDAEGRRVHRHLEAAARDWDAAGRDPGELYRGARLASALDWRDAGHAGELNAVERAFIDSSQRESEREARRIRRTNRRLRMLLGGVVALLFVAAVAGALFLHQRGEAREEARIAEAQRIGAQALTEPGLDRSLLLARQGVAIDDSPVTRGNLLAALLRATPATGVMRASRNPLTAIDIAPDGRTMAVGDSHGSVAFRDVLTRRVVWRPFTDGAAIAAVRFSPDGTRTAVAGYDLNLEGFVQLLDMRTRMSGGALNLGDNPTAAVFRVGTIAFTPDSRVLVADLVARDGTWRASDGKLGAHRYVMRFDARTGRRLGPRRLLSGDVGPAPALAGVLPGGRLVTSSVAAGETVIRDATTLRPVRRFAAGGSPATVSPDGQLAALARPSGSMRVLDLSTGRAHELGGRHGASITALRFTPDSRRLVAAGGDAPITVWDVRRAARVDTFRGHVGAVDQLAVARDGRTAYSAGFDGNVIAWDLSEDRRLGRPFRLAPGLSSDVLAVGADGSTFAVPTRGGDVELLDSRKPSRARRIRVGAVQPATGRTAPIAIAPDGRTLAASIGDGAVRFVDLATGRPLGAPSRASAGVVQVLAFSRDGRWLAASGDDQVIYLWDVRRQEPVGSYTGALGPTVSPVTSLSVSPDGSRLAATIVHRDGSGQLDILSIPRLKLLRSVRAVPGKQTQFSHDGRRLFYGDDAGRVWIFDGRTWKPQARPLAGHVSPGSFALSPDNRMLATTSSDGTTQLWDVSSGRPIGTALPGVTGHPVSAAFLDHGRSLVTLHDNRRGSIWDVRPGSWARRACLIAGRALTRTELQDTLPNRDYTPACAQP